MLTVQRFIRSEVKGGCFFTPSKNNLEIEQWGLVKANLLGMTACGSDWKNWTVC